jgi:hypothetical protein
MKKLVVLLMMAVFLSGIQSNVAQAAVQSDGEEFYIGKWELMAFGLPDGDTKMMMEVSKKDGKLIGWVGSPEQRFEFIEVTIKGDKLSVFFVSNGYDAYIDLEKDGEKVVGTMNDMFDMTATKIVEKKE